MIDLDMFNIIKDIKERLNRYASKKNRRKDLKGLCAIGSAKLFQELDYRGYDIEICYNDIHCFLRYNDTIIDITIKQFNEDLDIYISNKKMKYHTIKRTFHDIDSLIKYQKNLVGVISK